MASAGNAQLAEQEQNGATGLGLVGAMMAALALAWLPVPTERRRNRDSEFLPLHCSVQIKPFYPSFWLRGAATLSFPLPVRIE